MGRLFLVDLEGRAYRCRFCLSDLALADDVLSRVSYRVNITLGRQEERMMLSGMHTVEDIFCCSCGQYLGWKYVTVHEKSQKYKEGKFVLERWRIVDEVTEEFNLDTRPSSNFEKLV
ncbi:protein yippee-like [Quercus suber]|uniref:Protein yippee-like n=1 Tax=Quercus suber TaxID=58331 RepID=A0AAW0LFF2_QUESU